MNEFKQLLEVADRLHSPDGCPWDREQTFDSLKPYVLEEAHEVIDAVEKGEDAHLMEELGDLFYTVIFYAKIAEKSGRFTLNELLAQLTAKLIRRHPHVFGKEKAATIEDVYRHWDAAKQKEKEGKKEEGVLDSIPKTLPSLSRGQKVVKRMEKSGYPLENEFEGASPIEQQLLDLVLEANRQGIELEGLFRLFLKKEEERFRIWEKRKDLH